MEKQLFRFDGLITSVNPPVLCKSNFFRTSFVCYSKTLNKYDFLVCQVFHKDDCPIELHKRYRLVCELKGVKSKDDTGKPYTFNALCVDSYEAI